MVQQVLQRFDFTYSSPQATPLSTRHSLSALPSDESVEPSGPYPELVGCLMYLMTCTRPDLAYPLSILACYVAPGRHRPEHMAAAKRVLRYSCSTSGLGLVLGGRSPVVLTGHADASWVDDLAMQRSSQGYTFGLGSGSFSWRSTRSSSVLSSSCEAEIYAGAMAAQELRWLTYLLADLGEPPRSPPILYVDNKAMLALCQEHRLEHRTKHIALCYFLARELQQRGQLRLAYVASQANTAYIFTKALQPCDHQRFCTMLGVWQPGPKGSCRPQPQQAKRRLQMDADVDSRSDERLAKVQRSYVLQQVGQQRGQAGQMRGEEVEGGQSGTREQAGASRETGPGSKQAGVGHGEAWACEHDAGKLHGGGGRGNEFMTGGGEGAAGRRCGGAEEDAAGHGQDGQHHHITPRSRIGLLNSRSDAINMCYVNSTLQALASLPPFLSHLLHLPLPAPLARSSSLRLPVTTELQRLTRQLLGLPRGNGSGAIVGSISSRTRGTAGGVADASAVKRAVGRSARIFVGQEQQDAHEFLCSLLHCLASEATTIAAATASPPHTQAPTHTHTPTQPHDPAHTHTPSPILGEGRVPVGRAGEGGEGEVGREGGRGGGRNAIAERGGEGEARVEEARTADGSGCAVGTNFLSTVEVVRQCEGCGGRERGQEEFLCLSLPVPSSYLARPAPHPTTAGFSPPPAPAGSTAGARSSRGSRGSDTDPTAAAAALASLTHHPLSALLQHFFQDETVQGRACTHCHRSPPCRISQAFLRLPRILVLHLNRFQTTFHPTACLEKPTLCREEPSASLDNPPLCEPPHHAPPCPAPPSPHIAQHAHPLASRAPLDTSPPFPENPTTAPPSTPPAPSGKAPQATTSPARSRSPASPLLPAAGASSVNPFSLAKSAARHVVSREVVSKGVVCGLKGGGRLIRRVSKVGADAEEMENGGRVEGQVVGRIKLPSEVRAEEHEEGPRGKGEGRECEEEDEEVEEDWAELLEGAAGVIGEGAGDGGDANPVSVMVDGGRATSSRVGGGGGMEGMQASRGGYECRKNVDRVEIATLLNIGKGFHSIYSLLFHIPSKHFQPLSMFASFYAATFCID
ncbi:unnamed protein product [Closterium sp. NIES-54]